MKVLVCPDSFKGSVSAQTAAESIARGVHRACADAVVDLLPMADGGEGTVNCLLSAMGGQQVWVQVHDPLGRLVPAYYGVLPDDTVVLEAALAVGLSLVAEADRDVMRGNSYGVGQLIRHALDEGRTSFVVGLGGSATNDAGLGMLAALGARFYDDAGHELSPTPDGCRRLAKMDLSNLHTKLQGARFRIACDVTNPMCGPNGATAVYGPQKGVTTRLVPVLDAVLTRFADVVEHTIGRVFRDLPGTGAAGGLGGAFVGLLGGELVKGIDLVLGLTEFERRLLQADLVITGEGKTDAQTLQGKAVYGIARLAHTHQVPVFCLSGAITDDATTLYNCGVSVLLSITSGPISLQESISLTQPLLVSTAESAVRAFMAGRVCSSRTMSQLG